ncbi:MAG: hypothetical protein HY077_06505 [Elusimicrobia bacterium]|nr:hypothetical protein [Elusimicrobiota bacterium]
MSGRRATVPRAAWLAVCGALLVASAAPAANWLEVRLLLHRLADPDCGVRRRALSDLYSLGPKAAAAIEPVAQTVKNDGCGLREDAFGTLAAVDPDGFIDRLDRNPGIMALTSVFAGLAGRAQRDPKAFAALERALRNPDFFVRLYAAKEVSVLDPENEASIKVLISSLGREIHDDFSWPPIRYLLRAAFFGRAARPLLLRALESHDVSIKAGAVWVLVFLVAERRSIERETGVALSARDQSILDAEIWPAILERIRADPDPRFHDAFAEAVRGSDSQERAKRDLSRMIKNEEDKKAAERLQSTFNLLW